MAVCVNCGNDYDGSLKICPKCGARNNAGQEEEPVQKNMNNDDAQINKMHKDNRRNLVIMNCIFAVFVISGFFVRGQSMGYIIAALLFFPIFVLPMTMMKKWAAYVTLATMLVLVFTVMLGLIGGGYSTAPAVVFGALSAIFFLLYIIIIFQNMDEMV